MWAYGSSHFCSSFVFWPIFSLDLESCHCAKQTTRWTYRAHRTHTHIIIAFYFNEILSLDIFIFSAVFIILRCELLLSVYCVFFSWRFDGCCCWCWCVVSINLITCTIESNSIIYICANCEIAHKNKRAKSHKFVKWNGRALKCV